MVLPVFEMVRVVPPLLPQTHFPFVVILAFVMLTMEFDCIEFALFLLTVHFLKKKIYFFYFSNFIKEHLILKFIVVLVAVAYEFIANSYVGTRTQY